MEVLSPQRTIQADEADVILPPPSALNPVPTLPAALRVDNREQLVELILANPVSSTAFRQLLIFGDDSLRTLLMRQVLSNPHTRTFKAKKKNWDAHESYPLPKSLQSNIAGTRLLSNTFGPNTIKTKTKSTLEGAEVSLKEDDDDDDAVNSSFGDEKFHVDVVTYFLRPWDLAQTQLVIKRIQGWKKQGTHHRIVYLPQTTALVQQMLSDRGIAANPNVSITMLQLDVFPLETDVLSLEYAEALKDEVERTPSQLISTVARSILKLQDIVGTIPRIQSLGGIGEEIVKKLLNQSVDEFLSAEEEIEDTEPRPVSESESDVAAMLIIDRKVDMVTPMITPLTYEGLLDEIVGIESGFVKVNVKTINPDDDDTGEEKKRPGDELVMLAVNAGDSLYAEVRDQHVEKFGSFLQNQAMALRESHANFTNKGTKKDLSEIHQFVKQIPIFTQNLRSLTNHIHLAELVKHNTEQYSFREQWQTERSIIEGELCYDMLEEWISSGYPPYKLLRLLCLQSICAGGLKSSRYETFRTQVVQVYGYEFLFVLHDLDKLGLIKRRETLWMDKTSPWSNLRKSLILINAEVDTIEPDDVSYVSSGYAPLSVRLVQSAIQGWSGKEDILKDLPGRLVDVNQFVPPQDLASSTRKPPVGSLGTLARSLTSPAGSKKKPTLIVFYVGGVTLTEIAALRFLSKRPTFPYHIVCVTTKVMNGSTLLQTLG